MDDRDRRLAGSFLPGFPVAQVLDAADRLTMIAAALVIAAAGGLAVLIADDSRGPPARAASTHPLPAEATVLNRGRPPVLAAVAAAIPPARTIVRKAPARPQ